MRNATIIFVLTLLLGLPAADPAAETTARGDFEFFLDTAAFRNDDASTRQEIYVRIPNVGIRYKLVAERLEARVRLTFTIKDSDGKEVVDESEDLKMYAVSEDIAGSPQHFQTMTRRYNLGEGTYRLFVAVEDLNSPKVTVVGMFRNQVKTAVVEAVPLEVPTFPSDRMTFSDAKFLWDAKDAGMPNPGRLYGLYRDSLLVYVEAYVPEQIANDAIELRTAILNEVGEAVEQSSAIIPVSADATADGVRRMPLLLREDLNRFAAGTYTLYINGGIEEQLLVRVRAGNFDVAWDLRTWEVSRRSFISEARFLLNEEDFNKFQAKSIGEQEAILRAMWKDLDPDPTTGGNEAYEEFMGRLEIVNSKYTDYQHGFFTDRGLIYLKYGAPDEKIVDVIPLNRESIADALQKVEDKYHAVNFSNTGGRAGYGRPSRDVDPRRLGRVGEQGNEGYPYELWVYNDAGRPIRRQDRSMETDIGMRFIFIDREGYGRYRLESSSSMANK